MLGTVSLTMLRYLKLLTLLNHDLINLGNIKIWFMISKQNFTEPEVAVYIIIILIRVYGVIN